MSAQNPKEVFRKCGTCSQTFAHILNREFGHPAENEERALDPLAGGISNQGHQCGMLWGACMAVGKEAYRRHPNQEEAIATAVRACQHIIKSFVSRTDTVNCREIIGYNLNTVLGLLGFMIKTTVTGMNNSQCFNLAEDWAPEAIQASKDGLSAVPSLLNHPAVSCAAEVVKRMGGTEEEIVTMAGFAGGLGLSGYACGALSAAIWMKTLEWCKANPGKTPPYFRNPTIKKMIKSFKEMTDSKMLCREITGQQFSNIDEHAANIHKGGCKDLIEQLADC